MSETPPTLGQHGSLFESQAEVYSAYRPGYPPHVFEEIYSFADLSQKQLAVDVGATQPSSLCRTHHMPSHPAHRTEGPQACSFDCLQAAEQGR